MTELDRTVHAPTGTPDPADPTDVVTAYGYCRTFCAIVGPVHGSNVDVH